MTLISEKVYLHGFVVIAICQVSPIIELWYNVSNDCLTRVICLKACENSSMIERMGRSLFVSSVAIANKRKHYVENII